jgi:D-serine deaminase-like pyridoxal phosphate-dependent protein
MNTASTNTAPADAAHPGARITVSVRHKSFPPDAWGSSLDSLLAERPRRSRFTTPLLTLDRGALTHNTATMFGWLRDEQLQLAPHGKTTMSPRLWGELADAGAWGLTLATAWQAQVARSAGVRRIMIANAEVDPVGLRWLSRELDLHDDAEIICWVDSIRTIEAMEKVLASAGARRRVPVIAEIGAPGGRTGARSVESGLEVARRIHESDALELAGVGGYEGSIAHDRSAESVARVDAYLDSIAALHRAAREAGLYREGGAHGEAAGSGGAGQDEVRDSGGGSGRDAGRPIVTAGGSAYFDRVASRLGSLRDEADIVLRSGAFQIHDDGFYAGISPMGSLVGSQPFRSAMHAWVRVVSHPEPGLVLFDAGRRDLPFDEGLPVPQRVAGVTAEESQRILEGSRVTALNDQHGFLQLPHVAEGEEVLPVGTVIRLGLSHPCTAFDKWRLIPIVEDADADDPTIIDAVETFF